MANDITEESLKEHGKHLMDISCHQSSGRINPWKS